MNWEEKENKNIFQMVSVYLGRPIDGGSELVTKGAQRRAIKSLSRAFFSGNLFSGKKQTRGKPVQAGTA